MFLLASVMANSQQSAAQLCLPIVKPMLICLGLCAPPCQRERIAVAGQAQPCLPDYLGPPETESSEVPPTKLWVPPVPKRNPGRHPPSPHPTPPRPKFSPEGRFEICGGLALTCGSTNSSFFEALLCDCSVFSLKLSVEQVTWYCKLSFRRLLGLI